MEKETLREGWKIARETWPGVDVTENDFSEYVAERVEDSHASPPWSDLYLACACARGNPAALRMFDEHLLSAIEPDEVRQIVSTKLLVAEPGKLPKIAEYSGRGALRTWLRIVATRTALDLAQTKGREIPVERDALEFVVGAGEDPELDYFKQRYAAEFRAA